MRFFSVDILDLAKRYCSIIRGFFKVKAPKVDHCSVVQCGECIDINDLKDKAAMNTITWLHLSDLHFRDREATSLDRNVILTALLEDLHGLEERHDLSPDFILISGDIAYSGIREEYELAEMFFDNLLEVTKLSKERLLVVPGNHDINSPLISQGAKAIISSLSSRMMMEGALIDVQDRSLILRKFKGYSDFVNDYFNGTIFFNNNQYFWVRTLNLSGHNVVVLGLNSAWTASGGVDERGKLGLSERQVRRALEQGNDEGIKIALLHHPFDWLYEFDWNVCEPLLMDNCDFILSGHLHKTSLSFKETPDARAMNIAAGACYASRDYHNSYNIVRLDFERREGELFLRTWSDSGSGFWTEDTLAYRNVKNGIYHFLLGEYISVAPPDGDSLETIDTQFSRQTDRGMRLIRDLIPGIDVPLTRDEFTRVEEQFAFKKPVILTGDAGTGKSGIAAALVRSAQKRGAATLLLDSRRVGQIQNEAQLREYFDFRGPILSAIEKIGRHKGCRLIIDQLDNVVGSPSAMILVDLAIDCCRFEGVEVVVISRKRETHEERLLEKLTQSEFVELTSHPLSEFGVREILGKIGIDEPSNELVALGRNLLNLDLIGKVKEQQADFNFSTLMDEVALWEHYLKVLREQEEIGDGLDKSGQIIAEVMKLARDGLSGDNRTFLLDNPPSPEQRRLISWGIIVCDERVCRFFHEKLQDFLYARDATQRNAMPEKVLDEIDVHTTRNVMLWMEKIYARRDSRLHNQFLKETFNV
ncbi:MAG: metallophosphoesterase [Desulfobacteraceae bacterium]|nr:metallophosphoesterase [Desulfobacteraceae bacterium]